MASSTEYMRAYRAANRDKIRAIGRRYYHRNKEAARTYRENNRDHRLAYFRDYYRQNKDAIVEANSRWREENRQLYLRAKRRKEQRRRERKYGVSDGGLPAILWQDICLSDPCAYCNRRRKRTTTIDHIIPLARGGDGEWCNLTGACSRCNSGKGAKSVLEFLLSR